MEPLSVQEEVCIEEKILIEEKAMIKDYERQPVPEGERQGWFTLGLVWIGGVISLSATALGGALGGGMSLNQAIISTLIGSFILAILSSICCIVGARTGLAMSLVSSYSLGKKGAMGVSIVTSVALFGWFGVQLDLFGDTLAQVIYNVLGLSVSPDIMIVFGGVLMTLTAMFGYKAIEKLSVAAVPLLAILLFGSLYIILKDFTFTQLMNAPVVGTPIPLGSAISMVIGSLAVGVIIGPDYSRYARTTKDAILSSTFGYFIGTVVVLGISAILAKATGESDIISILIGIGWGTGAMVVLILAQWTTNNTNIYSASLNFSILFKKIPKYVLTLGAGVIGTGLAIAGIYDNFISFLSFLSVLIPPVGGLYAADYFMNQKDYTFDNMDRIKEVRWPSLINWGISSAVAFLTTAPPTGMGIFTITGASGLDSFVVAFVIQIGINKFWHKNSILEEEK
ncbi:cytosine permease [Irregularibacter muris]|uniref:Cytosine permease n=1 Tax=Irregularibacter muris TaxID=1796619 RepID=A0AAE3HFP5_9FIRM|nr:cytosine permease [Irregularibacter muris]MCR1899736.1 cytosine permease [Irregularibacter muris]